MGGKSGRKLATTAPCCRGSQCAVAPNRPLARSYYLGVRRLTLLPLLLRQPLLAVAQARGLLGLLGTPALVLFHHITGR
jgi:hypothetical protein